ncbi:Hypothetical protein ppKF707_0146 [Metapseudomonas furukawaii]|uniref:Replication initiation factor n=2 Tax=Metapseudomonas furukawaii TaxID=1149133 RepID=A0AAD1C674_METFU|nr:Hypothetical protein ppKF707_0146 [Pseudomonas furukawaii]BAU76509.1 hypothetical protein KF707C_48210 [Pseudomonas furukawaii]
MTKAVDQMRLDGLTAEPSNHGRLFLDPKTVRITDLSSVRLLGCRVDTVRQLYRGLIRPELIPVIEQGGIIQFAGHSWHAGRVGRDSGYQYKLQNADLGFVLLLKNFNVKIDVIGAHMKIEVSPHAIQSCPPEVLQDWMDRFAREAMEHMEPNQCAVHLALDVQGWTPPADLIDLLQCRARTRRDMSGIKQVHYDGEAVSYGRGQSFLFGSASGIQLALYNKSLQAWSIDKLDYWRSVWSAMDNPFDDQDDQNYDPEAPVWRIELRYHHSIVQQFADGSADTHTGAMIDSRTFAELAAHLDGLFQYGLQSFRLLSSKGVFDAFWTLMRQDVKVSIPAESLAGRTHYKRHFKTSQGFTGKNVELFLGNFISLLARERVGAKKAFASLRAWACWPVIRDHYAAKGKSEGDIYKHIQQLLTERTIRWGRAV